MPTLMNRLAAGPDYLVKWVGDMMESLSCTSVSDEVHDWYEDILRQESEDEC